jgi:2-methylcitrate dehydratase
MLFADLNQGELAMTQLIAELLYSQQEGHPRSTIERIAAFAATARPEHLTSDTRRLYKRNILDSLGCAIAALQGPPFQALREQFGEYRAPGRCTLIGGGKTSPDQAALFNSGLVRYVDLLDSYMASGGLCHPSDNFGTVLAAAEQAGASGEEFMVALAVAYEIQCRFSAVVPVMAKGFNHATQLAISAAASAGKLLGLSAGEIANAIAIATVDNISLACMHAEPVSQWKGFSPGMTGMRAIYAAGLAKRGFEGPSGVFEGPDGLERMFGQPIHADWDDTSLEIVHQTVLKKYCSLIHGQPVLEAVLSLKRSNGLVASNIKRVHCDVLQGAFDFAGGGRLGPKDHPQAKEQADYNLKYLIAVALLDDQVGPAQLQPARIQAQDVQTLLAQVDVRPDERFTARYPKELSALITIYTKDKRIFVKEQLGYEGGLTNPLSWDRTVEKFQWLSEPFADLDLRTRMIEAVRQIDEQPVSGLTDLLARVRPAAAFPATHRGIQ